MSSLRLRLRTIAACGVVACVSMCTTAHAVPISIYNTGVDNSGNAWVAPNVADIHYSLVVQPGSATAVTVDASNYPIAGGPWIANNAFSRWIGPDQTSFGPAGGYVYRTNFNIPNNAILSSVTVSGDWATDDPGTDIRINGTPTGQTSNFFTALTPFSVSSGFQFGNNTLDFYLTNAGGPTGLRVDHITGNYSVPEPAALCLAAIAMITSGAFLRRQRGEAQAA